MHIGNIRFRNEISEVRHLYDPHITSGDQKKILARKVVAAIKSRGGRFLKRLDDLSSHANSGLLLVANGARPDGPLDDLYVEVDDKVTIEKAKQCLRHQLHPPCAKSKKLLRLEQRGTLTNPEVIFGGAMPLPNPRKPVQAWQLSYTQKDSEKTDSRSYGRPFSNEESTYYASSFGLNILENELRKRQGWSVCMKDGIRAQQEREVPQIMHLQLHQPDFKPTRRCDMTTRTPNEDAMIISESQLPFLSLPTAPSPGCLIPDVGLRAEGQIHPQPSLGQSLMACLISRPYGPSTLQGNYVAGTERHDALPQNIPGNDVKGRPQVLHNASLHLVGLERMKLKVCEPQSQSQRSTLVTQLSAFSTDYPFLPRPAIGENEATSNSNTAQRPRRSYF